MSQHNSLVDHKMAFLLVQHQVLLDTPMLDSLQVDQAFFKAPSINCDIIHVDLHNALHQVTEDAEHASLECGRGITQAERHPPIGICAKWAGEGGLLLIFYSNLNLEIA